MKVNKKILIIAGILTLSGALITGITAALIVNSPKNGGRPVTKTIDESVSKIEVSVNVNDVRLISGSKDKITVTYTDSGLNGCTAEVKGDTLVISHNMEQQEWYDYIEFDSRHDSDITIIIPDNMSIDARLETKHGDIEAAGLTGSLRADSGSGDVEISGCDFDVLECNVDYGDIELKNSGARSVICNTDSGDIDCERLWGSDIKLSSDYGDIEGSIKGNEADYTINADTRFGENRLRNRTGGKNTLDIKAKVGDISLRFAS